MLHVQSAREPEDNDDNNNNNDDDDEDNNNDNKIDYMYICMCVINV